ncbi:MAG: dihydroorotate dehydrogenase electron transfer subunit [Candidatus Omnitrophota bacterium]
MVYQEKTKIISNDRINKDCFKLSLNSPKIAFAAVPGQFVSIRVSGADVPLLRRPFSIHGLVYSQGAAGKRKIKKPKADAIEILYEVVGKGSEILSQKMRGEYLDVIGPLGNGFKIKSPVNSHQSPVLVAGGMGVAPLVFLAERIAYSVERIAQSNEKKELKLSAKRYPLNAIVLIGARTKSQILCEDEFRKLGYEVKIATDDGSYGFKGKVTDLLDNYITHYTLHVTHVLYACGPKPMLKEIGKISTKYGIPAQISLEAHMACGIGACLGCVVKLNPPAFDDSLGLEHKTDFEYKRVCKDGPVFNADEIIWEG